MMATWVQAKDGSRGVVWWTGDNDSIHDAGLLRPGAKLETVNSLRAERAESLLREAREVLAGARAMIGDGLMGGKNIEGTMLAPHCLVTAPYARSVDNAIRSVLAKLPQLPKEAP
jgi:hypothetical protein